MRFTAEGRVGLCNYTQADLANHWLREICADPAWLLRFFKTVCLDRLGRKQSEPIEIVIAVYQLVKPQYRENGNSQNPILFAKNAPTCAGVRLSFPYYRVRMRL